MHASPEFSTSESRASTKLLTAVDMMGELSIEQPKKDIIGYFEVTSLQGIDQMVKLRSNQEILIGRHEDCNYTISHPCCSNYHFRIYSVIYECNRPPLVYCEDLSRNGAFLNGRLIGKNNTVLLSPNDTISIRNAANFTFHPEQHGDDWGDVSLDEDANIFSDSYTVTSSVLGKGGFGLVLMAWEKQSHKQVACKAIRLDRVRKDTKKHNFTRDKLFREVRLLLGLSHPNIINIRKVYTTPKHIYMFEDLICGGDLFSYIEKHGVLEESQAMPIFWQLLEALGYLHERGIAHRDLKPDNILLMRKSAFIRVVLSDFGAANKPNPTGRMNTLVGTAEYTAPEIGLGNRNPSCYNGYTESVDLWSLGIILCMMLSGDTPFTNSSSADRSNQEYDLTQLDTDSQWQSVSVEARDLIKRLVVVDPKKRLNIPEIKNHSWLGRYQGLLEDLYQEACRGWKERANPVEWVEASRTEYDNSCGWFAGSAWNPGYQSGSHSLQSNSSSNSQKSCLQVIVEGQMEQYEVMEVDPKEPQHNEVRYSEPSGITEESRKGMELELDGIITSSGNGWRNIGSLAEDIVRIRQTQRRQDQYVWNVGNRVLPRDLTSY